MRGKREGGKGKRERERKKERKTDGESRIILDRSAAKEGSGKPSVH